MCIFFVECTCCHCKGWVGCASSKENREKNGFYGQADHRGAQPDQKHLGKFWSNFPLLSVMRRYRTRVREAPFNEGATSMWALPK